jgi:Mg2+/Co2+ transporter CorB
MVVISAYFSGSETGMMTLNRYRLRHRAKQGNRAARRVEKLLRKPDRLISLVLIGNNLVNILASALGTIVGMRLYGNAGVAIATGVLTFVVLVFAEVLPKTIAALYPEKGRLPEQLPAGTAADPDDAAGLAAEHGDARPDADGGNQSRRHHQQRAQQRGAAHHRE